MGLSRTAMSLAVSIACLGACTLGSLEGLSGDGSSAAGDGGSPFGAESSTDGARDDGARDDASSAVDGSQGPVGDGATSGQQIASLRLVNVDTTQPIAGFDPLPDGVTLTLSALPPHFTMEALTAPAVVGSVVFVVDSAPPHVEKGAPYTVNMGAGTSQWGPWYPSVGSHVVRVTPYTLSGGNGQAGQTKTLAFVVTN